MESCPLLNEVVSLKCEGVSGLPGALRRFRALQVLEVAMEPGVMVRPWGCDLQHSMANLRRVPELRKLDLRLTADVSAAEQTSLVQSLTSLRHLRFLHLDLLCEGDFSALGLGDALAGKPLESLHLEFGWASIDGLVNLMKGVGSCQNMLSLDLRLWERPEENWEERLSDEGHWLSILHKCRNLEMLNLVLDGAYLRCPSSSDKFMLLRHVFEAMPRLQNLGLHFNGIPRDFCYFCLRQGLIALPQLLELELDLRRCPGEPGMVRYDFCHLATGMRGLKSLSTLRLRLTRNYLRCAALCPDFKILMASLCGLPLQDLSLDLEACSLMDEGLVEVMGALRVLTSLRSLHLRLNNNRDLTDFGCEAWVATLDRLQHLENLKLALAECPSIRSKGLALLATGLAKCLRLRTLGLDLTGVKIATVSAFDMARAVHGLGKLTRLELNCDGTGMSDQALTKMVSCVGGLPALTQLRLSVENNLIRSPGARRLANALKAVKTQLRALSLYHRSNDIGPAGTERLQRAIASMPLSTWDPPWLMDWARSGRELFTPLP